MKKLLLILYIITALVPSFLSLPKEALADGSCGITSAEWNPAGEQKNGWFVQDKTYADVIIKSTNCKGKPIFFSIEEADTCFVANCDNQLVDSGLGEKQLIVQNDNFTVNLMLGEEKCEAGPGFDCDMFIFIRDGNKDEIYDSYYKTNGRLDYECDGVCLNNAKYIGTTLNGNNDAAVNMDAQNKAVQAVGDTYTPLVPIGIGDGALTTVKTSDVGKYLQNIFLLAIGLCGALAVIMIVIASIQYMGNESIWGKTEARGKIVSSIMGLLIALGAYALLNTINPDLTGAGGLSVGQVAFQIDPETESAPTPATYDGAGTSKACTTGYVDVATYGSPNKINVCASIDGTPIASKLKAMVDAAKQAGLVLSGSGSRSYARQVQLRIDHHCADTYTASSSTCTPPTARPGHSNHEIGGAIDFTCNGNSIGDHSNACYVWLSTNAGTYGFQNLPSEPWHWSFNGK